MIYVCKFLVLQNKHNTKKKYIYRGIIIDVYSAYYYYYYNVILGACNIILCSQGFFNLFYYVSATPRRL